MAYQLKNKNLLYAELTDKIIRALFNVHNTLGGDLLEKYYQRAIVIEFTKLGLSFLQQVPVELSYEGKSIGRYLLDFLVEDKVILEIKKDRNFTKRNIEQLYRYLTAKNLRLGLLVNFAGNGVRIKRVLNLY